MEAILYTERVATPIIVSENDVVEVIPFTNENRYFKFYVPNPNDRGIMIIEEISFAEDAENLIIRIEANRPPSEEVFQKEEIFYSNTSSSFVSFFVKPESWHYIEIKFRNESIENVLEGSSKLRFKLRYLSNVLSEVTQTFGLLENDTSCNSSIFKTFYNNNVTDIIPYVQYDLLREASTESFVFSYELVKEMDANRAIPINITDKHFSLLKFDIREGTDIGGTLQFIIAFKPKVSRKNSRLVMEDEPQEHVVVACIRRGGIEIPTWPNLCVSSDVERPAQLMLNKTVDNSSILIPFPESGTWYASFKLFCGKCEPCNCSDDCQREYQECSLACELDCVNNENCSSCLENCRKTILELENCTGCDCDGPCMRNENITCNSSIIFDIGSKPCILGQCSQNGRCMFMISDGVVFSTCVCSNRYRGLFLSFNIKYIILKNIIFYFYF